MSSETVRGVPWIEVMPQLVGRSPGDAAVFGPQYVVPDSDQYPAQVDKVAEVWLRYRPDLPVAEALPTLDISIRFSRMELPARVRNGLYRAGHEQLGDIAGMCPADLGDIRNFGAGSLGALAIALVDLAARSAFAVYQPQEADSPSLPEPIDSVPPASSPALAALIADLRSLARVLGARGQATRSPIDGFVSGNAEPGLVMWLRDRLGSWSAAELFPGEAGVSHCARLLNAVLEERDERDLEILRRRTFADVPVTLDALAKEFSLTRERVRQLENKVCYALEAAIAADPLVSMLVDSVRHVVAHVMPLQVLLQEFPSIEEQVPAVGQPVWRVLDRLDDTYEIADGWVAAPTVSAAVATFKSGLVSLGGAYELVPVADIRAAHAEEWITERRTNLRRWLEYCGLNSLEGAVILGRGAMLDRALAVLAAAAEPLSAEVIHDRIAIERSLRSLKNQLGADARFVRVGRNAWALAEWGMDGYTSIREAIREVLERQGGEAALSELADAVAEQFGVQRQSVLAYAMAYPFASHQGVVRFAEKPKTSTKSPYESRRVYRRGGSWLYRATLTHDHVRGSGSLLPGGLASVLELAAGESVALVGPNGEQAVYWTGMQPTFGSVRAVIEYRELAEDDEVFFVLTDDGGFDIERVRPDDGSNLDALLAAIGTSSDVELDDVVAHVAAAVGAPGEPSASSVKAHLIGRGETDLALRVDGALRDM